MPKKGIALEPWQRQFFHRKWRTHPRHKSPQRRTSEDKTEKQSPPVPPPTTSWLQQNNAWRRSYGKVPQAECEGSAFKSVIVSAHVNSRMWSSKSKKKVASKPSNLLLEKKHTITHRKHTTRDNSINTDIYAHTQTHTHTNTWINTHTHTNKGYHKNLINDSYE